jgi:hypothetical protein
MIEPNNPIFVNYLGEIPINPDDLPLPDNQYRRRLFVGNGSDRPIGFTFKEMALLYWKIRSFKFNITGILPPRDALADFLTAGGASGGVAQATGGLEVVNLLGNALPNSFNASGSTKISIASRVRNRIKDRNIEEASLEDLNNINLAQKSDRDRKIFGDDNGPYASKVLHTRRNRDNKKTGNDYRAVNVNEGSLPAAGPVHKFSNNGCSLVIDFSYIVKKKYLYYPRIIVTTPWGNSWVSFSSETETEYGLKTNFNTSYSSMSSIYANIFFKNGGLIPIYYFSELQVGQTGMRGLMGPIINGDISIMSQGSSSGLASATSCCSRFYYDDSDKYRLENAKECKNCEQLGVGLRL